MELTWKRKENKESLQQIEKNGTIYLSFGALEQTGLVKHGFSTKLGGVSEGKFATMNLTFSRGDNPEHVTENYRRMAKALDVDAARIVLSNQIHTTNVRVVTEKDAGKGVTIPRDYNDVDGLITNIQGITLVTFYADCVPLYFVDPVHKAIGLSHSGWRGTVNRMGKVTLDAMAREYGTRPQDVISCIGPSICQECYEVGSEVAEAFKAAFAPEYWEELLSEKKNEKFQLDLWKANEIVMVEAGMKPEHIHVTDICTHCNPNLLFSHRAVGNERGNLGAFLCLNS